MTQATDALIGIAIVASRLNLSVRTCQRLIADGVLPSVTIGARRLVKASDLDAYIAGLA